GKEVVVEDVEAALPFPTFGGHARPDHLGQAVDVARVNAAPHVLELRPERLGPGLGAEDPEAEADALDEAVLRSPLREEKREGRRAREPRRAEIREQLHLEARVSARRRHHSRAETLAAVVEPEAAGEEPVAIGDV